MDVNFGERIKTLRKRKSLTQADLADMLGVSKTIVSAYESGLRKPSYDVLVQIALIFGVSMNWMFGYEESHLDEWQKKLYGFSENHKKIIYDLIDEFSR